MERDAVNARGGPPRRRCVFSVLVIASACAASAADEPAPSTATATATANPAVAPPAYWQVPPLPTAVIQGGPIPPGWQPQAVPYQGVGPDGRPVTMYFAPTYVFTYQSGPPVLATPQVNRGGWATPPAASGWNYATTGAAPVATTLPAGTVTRYRPAYQFPDDARALQGSAVVPPGALPGAQPAAAEAWGAAGPPTPNTLAPPPSQWVPVAPQATDPGSAPTPSGEWTGAGVAGATAAAMQPTPVAAPAVEQPAPTQAPPVQPLQPSTPPPAAPVARHTWRVVGVYDGDTVTCLDEGGQQQKVRLAGIDAPESSQDYGRASREALAGLVFGRTVEVVDVGRDASGALLGTVFVDGQDINRQMVATGNAWADPASVDPGLAAAQTDAQTRSLGLWAQPNPVPPSNDR